MGVQAGLNLGCLHATVRFSHGVTHIPFPGSLDEVVLLSTQNMGTNREQKYFNIALVLQDK